MKAQKAGQGHRGARIEDAIGFEVQGAMTLEQWKRAQAAGREPVHVVRPQRATPGAPAEDWR